MKLSRVFPESLSVRCVNVAFPRGTCGLLADRLDDALESNLPMKNSFGIQPVSIVTDDGEAQTIMLENGVLHLVSTKQLPTDTVSICVAEDHPTHWLMCARHWENPNPSENGYMVVAFRKDMISRVEVEARMHAFLAGSTQITARPIQTPHS